MLPILVLTVVAAARLYTDRSTNYWVTGTQLLMSGSTSEDIQSENAVAVAVDLLDDLLTQPSVSQQLVADGLSGTYQFEVSPTGRTIRLDVQASSADQAVATAAALIEIAPEVLTGSLGDRVTDSLVIEQATAGSAEDATAAADGTFHYSTVIVVGTEGATVNTPFPASLGTVRLMTEVVDSLPFRLQFRDANPTATFEVTRNIRESPILQIVVRAASPEEALAAHQSVVTLLAAELDQLQADAFVDVDQRTRLWTLVDAIYAVPTPTSQVRPAAAVTVLGVGLAIGLATVLESIVADRRRRRASTEKVGSGPTDAPAPRRDEHGEWSRVSRDDAAAVDLGGESGHGQLVTRRSTTSATTS